MPDAVNVAFGEPVAFEFVSRMPAEKPVKDWIGFMVGNTELILIVHSPNQVGRRGLVDDDVGHTEVPG